MSPYTLILVFLFAFVVHATTELDINLKGEYPTTEDSTIFKNGLKVSKLLHNYESRENVKQTVENGLCASNPCLNEGACFLDGSSFACICNEPFTGERCEISICSHNPCQNGGTCVENSYSYKCSCLPGYIGENCETACNCGKDSNCTIERGWLFRDSKICICKKGYRDIKGICMGPCLPNPCVNGGTCLDIPDSFKCTCLPGYTGEKCESGITTKISTSSGPMSSISKETLMKTTLLGTSMKTMLWNTSMTPTPASIKITSSEVSMKTNLFPFSRTSPFRNSMKTTPMMVSQETSPYSIKTITSTTSTITTKASCECRHGCTTNEKGETVCKCLPGYGLYAKYLCKECRCGENVECSFDKYRHKKCHCPHGFVEFQDKCKECYCGLNSACSFDYFGAKKCLCPDGFAELSGICTKCYCGQNSACFFDKYGSKKCECEDGFIEMNGKCKDVCDVYPCIHGTCIKTAGKGAACECNKNYKGIFCDVEKEKIIEVKRESVISVVFLGVMLSVFLLQFLIFAYLQCRRQ